MVNGSAAEPIGEWTFLFTDVERSSLQWLQNESEMAQFIPAVNGIIERECVARGGEVFGREGDGRAAMFRRPTDALAAAMEAQFGLHGEAELTGGLAVRMGIHTGRVLRLSDGELGGTPLNYVGRMHKVAHGGQVILSEATRSLVEDDPPTGCALADLGMHTIRDFEPSSIWQLCHPRLPQRFPPLNTRRRYEAPQFRIRPFVGREEELGILATDLREQLVTLTGPGGIGKTRLARQAVEILGHRFRDGVCYVELQGLSRPDEVGSAVSNAVGTDPTQGATAEASIARTLSGSDVLLVLDSCEPVRAGAARVAAAVMARPGPAILATSRLPLGVVGERLMPLAPLPTSVPDPPDEAIIGASDAVRLFELRAREARPGFEFTAATRPAVVRICELLDGVPLSIELAAARVRVMSLDEIIANLHPGKGWVTGHAPLSRLSMDDAVDWSFSHLDTGALDLLSCLSRFHPDVGAHELQAIYPTPAPELFDALDRLVQLGLVRVNDRQQPYRYRLLEPLRHRARRAGVRDVASDFGRDHSTVYLDLAMAAEDALKSSGEVGAVAAITADLGNIRVAIDHAIAMQSVDSAARAVFALHEFSFLRMNYELYEWVGRLLNTHRLSEPEHAGLLGVAALGAFNRGDLDASVRLARECEASAHRGGVDVPIYASFAFMAALGMRGYEEGAQEYFRQASEWADRHDDRYFKVNTLVLAAMAMTSKGDVDVGAGIARHALGIAEELGNPSSVAWAGCALGDARRLSDPSSARRYLETAVDVARSTSARWIEGQALLNLARLTRQEGDPLEAAHVCIAALAHCQTVLNPIQSRQAVRQAFLILHDLDEFGDASRLLGVLRRPAATVPASPDLEQATQTAAADCEHQLGSLDFGDALVGGRAMDDERAVGRARSSLQTALVRRRETVQT